MMSEVTCHDYGDGFGVSNLQRDSTPNLSTTFTSRPTPSLSLNAFACAKEVPHGGEFPAAEARHRSRGRPALLNGDLAGLPAAWAPLHEVARQWETPLPKPEKSTNQDSCSFLIDWTLEDTADTTKTVAASVSALPFQLHQGAIDVLADLIVAELVASHPEADL